MTDHDQPPSPPKEAPPLVPFEKAGVIITGEINGVEYVLATYSEGRFGKKSKCYGMTKGSVEVGAQVFAEGLREGYEESGIDITKLIGAENIEKLRRGEAVENVPSGYSGVTIKQITPQMLDLEYDNRHGNPKRMALLKIELDGIEHLYPHLKNPENRLPLGWNEPTKKGDITPIFVNKTAQALVDKAGDRLPTRANFIDWMIHGRIPKWPWTTDEAEKTDKAGNTEIAGEPLKIAPEFETRARALRTKLADAERNVKNLADDDKWKKWVKDLSVDEKKTLRHLGEQIKLALLPIGITSDNGLLKLNVKDLAFNFYQEGADLIPADVWLEQMIAGAGTNRAFAKSLGGKRLALGDDRSRAVRWSDSQVAAVVWSTGNHSEKEFSTIAERLATHFKAHPPEVKTGTSTRMFMPGDDLGAPALATDFAEIAEHAKRSTVPVAQVMAAINTGRVVLDAGIAKTG